MKDYGFGYLAMIGVFLVIVWVVATAALPLLAATAQRVEVLGR